MNKNARNILPKIQIEHIASFDNEDDLHSICEALEASILAGYHCKWSKAPPRHLIESYFTGLLLIPEKRLFIGRMDGTIVGLCEVTLPPKQDDSPCISVEINCFATAPYATGLGIGRKMLTKMEQTVTQLGFPIINASINETQTKLLQFYIKNDYQHWATHPYYQKINGQILKGYMLYKSFLTPPS
ncbi:hypothetical protein COMNV_01575 [Commensalibacter sp. Nvir]|uniref:GNAT family N-acetyltransferase n=1 Tax=Commensalibacter sp. Nvir TaxID=3069817 RepID=UPI002D388628|nr:hypothetical protein COMNV_01575 [Commensalibacter sp. Nvir]